jgi:type I restriction enzyme M protein
MNEGNERHVFLGLGTAYMMELTNLWYLYNDMRGASSTEEYLPRFLFLTTLERLNYFEGVNQVLDIENWLSNEAFDSFPYVGVLREILANGTIVPKRGQNVSSHLLSRLTSIHSPAFVENYGTIFNELLYVAYDQKSKYGGEYLLTEKLSFLIKDAVNPKDGDSIFNPFAGLASFGFYRGIDVDYSGKEINPKIYDFARLRAVAMGKDFSKGFDLTLEDAIYKWPDGKRFDFVVGNPPFHLRLKGYDKSISQFRNAENFLIRRGLDILKPKGKMVVLVSNGFLFRGGSEAETRKFLIEEDLLETVLDIPGGMLSSTSIKTAILVINLQKKNPGKVKMISGVISKFSGKSKKIASEKTHLEGDKPDPMERYGQTVVVGNDQIEKQDYQFSPDRYLLPEHDGVELRNLLTLERGEQIENMQGRLTSVKDLISESNESEFEVRFSALTEDDIMSEGFSLPRSTRMIRDSVLLVAMVGNKLKPTFFNSGPKHLPVYLSPQVKAFRFDQKMVNPEYLVYQLRTETVQSQLRAYQQGTAMPRINVADFLRIKILLPSLQEQELTMGAFSQVNAKMVALRKERNALAHGLQTVQNTRFASLKHALGRPQQSILSAAKTLKSYLEQLPEVDELNRKYAEFFDQERTITDTLQGIINDIDFVSRLMDRGENGLQINETLLEEVTPKEVVKFIRKISVEGCKFKLEVVHEQNADWGKITVLLNLQLLKVLLDNLISNAEKHGFDDMRPDNLMRINISIIDQRLVIEVQNNGKSFPPKFTRAQYIQEFRTSHSDKGQGIGGFQVHQIATLFGDKDWQLTSDPKEIFPVRFLFRFPIHETVLTP